jgi:Ca2+-binding RTX toxin-like protein
MRRSAQAAFFAAIVALSLPSAAGAGTVNVVNSTPFTATFRAGAGEFNDLRIARPASGAPQDAFTDANVFITVGKGCSYLPTGEAVCNALPIDVFLGDQPDKADAVFHSRGRIYGGAGDDTITADEFGGGSQVYGEGGDDEVTAGGDGGQIADGGPGDDIVHSGGAEADASGIGGTGNDVILNRFSSFGRANLQGGAGDDIVTSTPNGVASTIDGGPGDDIISIDGPERIQPFHDSRFTITSGDGNDSIIGGPKDDTIDSGPGRDLIDVRDGGSDSVTCGDGVDVVRYDPSDSIASDCEIRQSS